MALAAALAAAGCSDSNGPGGEPFSYPLTVGSYWWYAYTYIVDRRSPAPDDTTRGTLTITVAKVDTLASRGTAYRLVSHLHLMDHEYEGAGFYQEQEGGLYLVATCGNNQDGLPRRVMSRSVPLTLDPLLAPVKVPFAGDDWIVSGDGCTGGDMQYVSPAAQVLQYPLHVGASWDYRWAGEADRVEKTVETRERFTTPVGSFDSYRVRWSFRALPDVEIVDHVADRGLAHRWSIVRNLIETTPENQFEGDSVDVITTITLDSLSVPGTL